MTWYKCFNNFITDIRYIYSSPHPFRFSVRRATILWSLVIDHSSFEIRYRHFPLKYVRSLLGFSTIITRCLWSQCRGYCHFWRIKLLLDASHLSVVAKFEMCVFIRLFAKMPNSWPHVNWFFLIFCGGTFTLPWAFHSFSFRVLSAFLRLLDHGTRLTEYRFLPWNSTLAILCFFT